MRPKNELNCPNCGAPINRETMRCEYCGTQFKRDDSGLKMPQYLIRVEHPKVQVYEAYVKLPYEYCDFGDEKFLNGFVNRELANKLAEAILDETEIKMQEDPMHREFMITGRLRVVRKGERI